MPTYEYACKECGEHHEVHQSFSDPSLTECPSCGGPLRKVFGNIGIAFKGSGFYKNDSRSSNGKKDQKKDAAQQEPDARADPLQDSDHDLPLVLPDLGETRGRGRVSNI